MVDHANGEARVGAEEKGLVHDAVGLREWGCDAHGVGVVAFELDEGGLADEVASEEHAVANFVGIEVADDFGAGEGGGFLDGDFEAEPGAVRAAAAFIPKERGIEPRITRITRKLGRIIWIHLFIRVISRI